MLVAFLAVLSIAGDSRPRADDPSLPAKPAFEAGELSIGEPIALPFTRPKAAAEPNAPASAAGAAAPGAAPGQGWLGITVAESNVPGRWTVDEVAPRSPARAAGINPGDEVRAIGGLPLRNADDVAQALTSISPGQEVQLAIGRGEQVSDVTLTAVPRPAAAARALQNLPTAEPAATPTGPAPEMTALAAPPAAPAAGLAPLPINTTAPLPAAQPLGTLPVAAPSAPSVTLPNAPPEPLAAAQESLAAAASVAPPTAAFAAAPPMIAEAPAALDAAPAAARFPARSAPPEQPAAPGTRFEPVAVAEPPSRMPQPAAVPGGRIALGVRTIPIDPGMQARFNLPAASGAYVIGVVGDLPASRAGVPPGSVIVALDERPVRSPDELTRLVTSGPVGKPVPLEYVLPGGTSRRADVVLQTLEQPLEEALVGPPGPTATAVPTLQPRPEPTAARRPVIADDAGVLRSEIRRLEARLEALEQRLGNR